MDRIRVLIWYPFNKFSYMMNICEKVKNKFGIEYKDKSDFGFEPDYFSQEDFDRIIKLYCPNIIFLYNITTKKLPIDIPENIKVITYCDHFHEQFSLLGRAYFENISINNYLYIPVLDVDRIDMDNVLSDSKIKDKMYFAPFVATLGKRQFVKNEKDRERFACDLSIVSNYKDIASDCWWFNINSHSFQGRILMQLICELRILIRHKIKEDGAICVDDKWIHEIIIGMFDKFELNQYINDRDAFIKVWINAIKYYVISNEYMSCVVDWLIEKNYNIKIYGSGWDESDIYKKYAVGMLEEDSVDLCKAYQYSKINVGLNVNMGLHRRNFEVMENGCLCFQAYVGDEYMFSDYNHFFQDGRDIVVYRNKQELYDKIDYYLSHDNEREQIIKAGQSVVEKYLQAEDVVGNAIKAIYNK